MYFLYCIQCYNYSTHVRHTAPSGLLSQHDNSPPLRMRRTVISESTFTNQITPVDYCPFPLSEAVFSFILLFLYQFLDIQLVVTVLSHRCNTRTDWGEAKVESHATLLHQCDGGNTVQLATEVSVHRPGRPQGVARARWDKDIQAGQTLP